MGFPAGVLSGVGEPFGGQEGDEGAGLPEGPLLLRDVPEVRPLLLQPLLAELVGLRPLLRRPDRSGGLNIVREEE